LPFSNVYIVEGVERDHAEKGAEAEKDDRRYVPLSSLSSSIDKVFLPCYYFEK